MQIVPSVELCHFCRSVQHKHNHSFLGQLVRELNTLLREKVLELRGSVGRGSVGGFVGEDLCPGLSVAEKVLFGGGVGVVFRWLANLSKTRNKVFANDIEWAKNKKRN